MTKGVYVAPGKQPPEGERKIYLLIEGPTETSVKQAKQVGAGEFREGEVVLPLLKRSSRSMYAWLQRLVRGRASSCSHSPVKPEGGALSQCFRKGPSYHCVAESRVHSPHPVQALKQVLEETTEKVMRRDAPAGGAMGKYSIV